MVSPRPLSFCRRSALFCLSVFGCWISSPAFSSEVPLSLVGAQTLAVARSRQLESQDFSVVSAQEMAVAARQLPDPIVKMGIDNLPINGTDRFSLTNDSMTMRRVGVMQEMTSSDKRLARARMYERTAEKIRADKVMLIANIQRDTALAWLDLYFAEKMALAMKEQVLQNRLEIQAAESAYRGGRTTQAELLTAESTLALLEDKASEIQQKALSARVMLSRWIGSAAEDTLGDLPAMDNVRLNVDRLETQLQHHPQIAVLNQQISLAEADTLLEKANLHTDWSVGLTYQQRASAYSNMVSVEVSIPIQWDKKNRQDRTVYAKQALVDQATAERDEVVRQHSAETRALLSEWQNNQERIRRFETEVLPLASQQIQAMLAVYRGGKASLLELLTARRSEIELRIQLLQLHNDTARLWAQLNFLTPTESSTVVNKELP